MRMREVFGLLAVSGLCVVGCAHTPTGPGERADLVRNAEKTVARMEAKDPTLKNVIDSSAGYVVFPTAGDGGFLVGGGAGTGVLFEHGRPVHFAELHYLQGGALAGGQKYSEVIVIRNHDALEGLRTGRLDVGGTATAVIGRTGVAKDIPFDRGIAVFVDRERGAIVNASLVGQRVRLTL